MHLGRPKRPAAGHALQKQRGRCVIALRDVADVNSCDRRVVGAQGLGAERRHVTELRQDAAQVIKRDL
jgi:hypothetical protein